jgi:hypothetical protein
LPFKCAKEVLASGVKSILTVAEAVPANQIEGESDESGQAGSGSRHHSWEHWMAPRADVAKSRKRLEAVWLI